MAPIRHLNNRVEAIGKLRDMIRLNKPSEELIEVANKLTEFCDPYTKFLLDYYLEIEKQRMDFFKMAGPIFEGVFPGVDNRGNHVQEVLLSEEHISEGEQTAPHANDKLRGSIKNLTFEVVAPKFVYPIEKAARELSVSEATLSLWCRISGIDYWPYRKLKSIDLLMQTIQDIGHVAQNGDDGVDTVLKMLQEERKAILDNPNQPLKQDTLVTRKRMHNLMAMRRHRKRNLNNFINQANPRRNVEDSDNICYLLRKDKMDKMLSFDLVSPHFGMPIERAAQILRVHKKTQQRWCRINGISCWPYKKIQSMKKSINNVQDLRDGEIFGQESSVVRNLEEKIMSIEINPMTPIQESTKALMKAVNQKAAWRRKLMKANSTSI